MFDSVLNVSDGTRNVSIGVRNVSDGARTVLGGVRQVSKIFLEFVSKVLQRCQMGTRRHQILSGRCHMVPGMCLRGAIWCQERVRCFKEGV